MKHAFEINCAVTAFIFLMSVRFVTTTKDVVLAIVVSAVIGAMVFTTALSKRLE